MMKQPILHIEQLSVDILRMGKRIPVLKGINLVFHRGEVHALIGPSGSGKSTLSAILTGVIPQHQYHIHSGHIWWYEGEQKIDLLTLEWKDRLRHTGTKMNLIFQEPSSVLDPVMTVGQQLVEGLGQDFESQLNKMFGSLGLDVDQVWSSYPWQLSGGQQQRCLLARALASGPELIIADEPTSALDQHHQKAFLADLRAAITNAKSPGLLLISHDLDLVARFADRVSILDEGLIVEQGSSDIIRKQNEIEGDSRPGPAIPQRKQKTGFKDTGTDWLLKTENLSGGYVRGRAVIEEISFALRPGEVVGIAGASGSGKSSFLRALTGLLPWSTGRRLAGHDLHRGWADVQLVYQDPGRSLNPSMTVRKTFEEWLRLHHKGQIWSLTEILADVGLEDKMMDRMPHMFSGGQRQRLAIARTLLTNPRVLLADEPFSNLDESLKDQILEMICANGTKRQMGVLVVAHDLPRLMRYCDRILIFDQGKVYWEGHPSDLLATSDAWLHVLLGKSDDRQY